MKNRPPLFSKEYLSVDKISGPLMVINQIHEASYDEIVHVIGGDGRIRIGRVLQADRQYCLVQVFVGTEGLDLDTSRVRFTGDVARLGISLSMSGRIFNGVGEPIDDRPQILPEVYLDLNGFPINPVMRAEPQEFIQTGFSAIDGLYSLARGQKLPIFSASGLPGNRMAVQIATQARVRMAEKISHEPFTVVFAAIGITKRESAAFMEEFKKSGTLSRTVVFLNHADDPTIERILTPRVALTVAEYLAFTHRQHVLVILTDMTNYCEAIREIAVAREELPGRRGYPGYLYSELASLFERAGRLRNKPGSITQLILLTMPDDDITHPIPDLTGYIAEGQIVLSRNLHQKNIFPPIDILPSLSRLMKVAIGEGKTREDHRAVADQCFALYAEGCDLRRLMAIVGESALNEQDRQILVFAREFEEQFIHQGETERDIFETFQIAWNLLRHLPVGLLKRVTQDQIRKYGTNQEIGFRN